MGQSETSSRPPLTSTACEDVGENNEHRPRRKPASWRITVSARAVIVLNINVALLIWSTVNLKEENGVATAFEGPSYFSPWLTMATTAKAHARTLKA